MGRPDFGRPASHATPSIAHALHDDDADGDEVEAAAKPKSALPLGCRWRVPLTQVHNSFGILFLYQDHLDA